MWFYKNSILNVHFSDTPEELVLKKNTRSMVMGITAYFIIKFQKLNK